MSKFCTECFSELKRNGECVECDDSPKKKTTISDKRKTSDIEMFRPEDEGKTWERVKSPYKKYKEGV